jgi:hypothetical protein
VPEVSSSLLIVAKFSLGLQVRPERNNSHYELLLNTRRLSRPPRSPTGVALSQLL